MLRFKPDPAIPDGVQPPVGAGSTYTLPTAESPNGPNLFDGNEGGGGKARPEIYAMGLRNPSRLSIDPETDVPYTAWVGPDAGQPSATLGPSTYENAAQITTAGNYGWPFCMGGRQAYRDRVADGTRASSSPRLRAGRPGERRNGRLVRLRQPRQRLDPQHGPDGASAPTGTRRDAGKMRPNNLWYSRGNPTAPTAVRVPRARGVDGAPDYGPTRASSARTPRPTGRRS